MESSLVVPPFVQGNLVGVNYPWLLDRPRAWAFYAALCPPMIKISLFKAAFWLDFYTSSLYWKVGGYLNVTER